MPASFELAVSQQMARMRALERALHDEGPWSFRAWVSLGHWDWNESDAERIVQPAAGQVTFQGTIWSPRDCEVSVELMCGSQEVSCRTIELPKGNSQIQWTLGLQESLAA